MMVSVLTDKIYDDIRKKILNLDLKPGSGLNFSSLRDEYKVSNSPVRDALKKLEAEGLVCIKPQSGTAVARIDLALVEDERFRRLYLELGAIEQVFAKGITENFINSFKKLIEAQKRAFACRDSQHFLTLDDRMHKLFFEECGHGKIFDSMMDSSGNYSRIRMVSYLFDDVFRCSLDQHIEILEALEKGDKQKTLETVRSHISRIENETLSYRSSYPQYFI